MTEENDITLYVEWRDLLVTICVLALLVGMMR